MRITPLRGLPISKKLMRMSMIVSASVLLFSCAAFIGYELLTFKSSAAEHLATNADIVGINVTPPLLFNDNSAAAESLAALRAIRNIDAAAIYTSDGRIFAKYVRSSGYGAVLPKTLPVATRSAHRMDGDGLIVVRPILSDEKPIGMVYIRANLKEIEQRLRSYAMITLGVLVASFAVALLVSSILEKRISKPILDLAETARTIASQNDYSTRAVIRSNDEIGILGEAFNDMLRQIEQQNDTLQESERNFRELADAMPQIVWTANAEGEPAYFNQRWFDYAGIAPGHVSGGQKAGLHRDEVQKVSTAWEESVHQGTPFNAEYRLRRASDGTYRWHLARALPIRDKHGQLMRWFGTLTDIDDQKKSETQVRQANAELELRVAERTEKLTAANKDLASAIEAQNRFLASMSHELRTPLNAIIGFTGTLLMKLAGPLTADQENQLTIVRSSARHLLSLINDLLDLAKIESGKVVLNLEPLACQSVVEEVAKSLRPLAEAKGLSFEVRMPEQDVVLATDRRALSQILINLTNNAIKFTEKGFVRLEVMRGEDGGKVELAVSDSGMGIRDEDQQRLFRAFEQVHGRSKGHIEGTGLGLHLSQKLASLLGGKIMCESKFGSGSRFSLLL